MKRILVEEAGGCCAVCGYDRCIVSLHFHHVDPRTKAFGINLGHGKSLAAFREEARKCVLVCANCHGEIESGVTVCPPPGSTYLSADGVSIGAEPPDVCHPQLPLPASRPAGS